MQSMVDMNRQYQVKLHEKEERKKDNKTKVKMNFKREVKQVDVEYLIENTQKSPTIKTNLLKMETIRDHYETKFKTRTKDIEKKAKVSSKRDKQKSRNLLNYMNTDNKEVNIILELKMNNTKIKVLL
jgi:hypothetical protein